MAFYLPDPSTCHCYECRHPQTQQLLLVDRLIERLLRRVGVLL